MKKIESVWADITAKNEAYKQKFSKQEKVELSAVEVKLSIIGRLNKLAQDAKDLQGELEGSEREI